MSKWNRHTDEEIIEACNSSISMSQAATKLGIHYNTLKRRAAKLGVYKPNMGLKGGKRGHTNKRISTDDILAGKHPSYQTNKLRIRLFEEGYKEKKCEGDDCGIVDWRNKEVSFELDHIDGNRRNHKLENLKILCPNCHSQTPTYRSRRRDLL